MLYCIFIISYNLTYKLYDIINDPRLSESKSNACVLRRFENGLVQFRLPDIFKMSQMSLDLLSANITMNMTVVSVLILLHSDLRIDDSTYKRYSKW